MHGVIVLDGHNFDVNISRVFSLLPLLDRRHRPRLAFDQGARLCELHRHRLGRL